MIFKDIEIFLQNVQKNNLSVNIILETYFVFNIVFIQELFWSTICSILSSKNRDGEELVGVLNHPNWLMFMNTSSNINKYLKVITYVNIRLSSFWFYLCKDIYNHRDILLVSFLNNNDIFFVINIYSDLSQSALKHFKNTKDTISYSLIYLSVNFFTGLSLNTKSLVLSITFSSFFHSSTSRLSLSTCLFISFYAFFNITLAFFYTFLILSTNSVTFSTLPFLLIFAPICNSLL